MLIKINIANKRPQVDGTPVIVCGNNDYQIQFTFDEEWEHSKMKNARFAWRKGGKALYIDVPFVGDTVDVPMLSEVHFVYVGVYTDSLHTTTPARIACEYSIRCNSGEDIQEPTPEDVLIDLFNLVTSQQDAAIESADIATRERAGAESAAAAAAESEAEAREAAADALACVGTAVRVWEGNTRDSITFWAGTREQYDAIPEKVQNCLYIITDDTTYADALNACVTQAGEAKKAAEQAAKAAQTAAANFGRFCSFDFTDQTYTDWSDTYQNPNLLRRELEPQLFVYNPSTGIVNFVLRLEYAGMLAKGEQLGCFVRGLRDPVAENMSFSACCNSHSFSATISCVQYFHPGVAFLTITANEDINTYQNPLQVIFSGWYFSGPSEGV